MSAYKSFLTQPLNLTWFQTFWIIVLGGLSVSGLLLGAVDVFASQQRPAFHELKVCASYPNALFYQNTHDPITGIAQIVMVDLRGLDGPQQLPPGTFVTLPHGLGWKLTDPIPCRWTDER